MPPCRALTRSPPAEAVEHKTVVDPEPENGSGLQFSRAECSATTGVLGVILLLSEPVATRAPQEPCDVPLLRQEALPRSRARAPSSCSWPGYSLCQLAKNVQPCSAINSFKSCDRCPFVPDTRPPRSAARRAKVIGVVRDTGTRGLSPDDVLARQPSQFYRSYTQAGLVPATVIART